MIRGASAACAAILLSGCQSMNAGADVPAVIVNADDASRAALQATVNGLFAGRDVMLADDALTTSSVLLLEHGPRGQMAGDSPATGRIVEEPLRLRLVKNGDDCVLIDPRDDSRHLLADTSCRPE